MTFDTKASFTAADAMPAKLLLIDGVRQLLPIHVQWLPTNQCNLHCEFCSCAEDDRKTEMPWKVAETVIRDLAKLGSRAVTVTGGGEPLLHPHVNDMILLFKQLGIEVGLVTNGIAMDNLSTEAIACLTWCRISHSDDRSMNAAYRRLIDATVARGPSVDWAFSYVVTRKPDIDRIRAVVKTANELEFTHVRLVADILHANEIDLSPIRKQLKGIDERVLYQPRNAPVPSQTCAIGYVKPLIAADFKMYLCCGVQYALEPPVRHLPDSLCMGSALDLDRIYGRERRLFHVPCVRCYYENYNAALRPLVASIKHKEFI